MSNNEEVSFDELVLNMSIEQKVLTDLLISKGIISKEEIAKITYERNKQTDPIRTGSDAVVEYDEETSISERYQLQGNRQVETEGPKSDKRRSIRKEFKKVITCTITDDVINKLHVECDLFDASDEGLGLYVAHPLAKWTMIQLYDDDINYNIGFVCNCTKLRDDYYRVGIAFI